jgi:hypothetical protein
MKANSQYCLWIIESKSCGIFEIERRRIKGRILYSNHSISVKHVLTDYSIDALPFVMINNSAISMIL